MQKKILVYGGNFNPCHLGHIQILKDAIEKISPDQTIVYIDRVSVWKKTQDFVPVSYRLKMLQNLFAEQNLANITIYENPHDLSYAIDIINDLKSVNTSAELYYLVGSDQYKRLNEWKDYLELNDLCTFVCHKRDNDECRSLDQKHIILDLPSVECNSLFLRQNLSSRILGETNYHYILDNNLYLIYRIVDKLSEYRYLHTKRVLETITMIALANNFSDQEILQAQIAATLHDIAKLYSNEQLKSMIDEQQLKQLPTVHCAHGIVGAEIAKNDYHVTDPIILEAITNHVIYQNTNNKISQALFCADKLEPNRTSEDINDRQNLLDLVCQDLTKNVELVVQANQVKYR